MKKGPLDLMTEVAPGDTILVCDGVAISAVTPTKLRKKRCV